jgi:predicted GIY-YIG superfamily endonuclease
LYIKPDYFYMYLSIYMPFFVYLLVCERTTYVGATVDVDHRLRQHNGEIKGGAKATNRQVQKGKTWVRAAHIRGFPTWNEALKFEWRWKQITRKSPPMRNGLQRRLVALRKLMGLRQSTSTAVPFESWDAPPTAVMETEPAKQLWGDMPLVQPGGDQATFSNPPSQLL